MRKFFSFKLYREGLRQTSRVALIFLSAMMLGAIFTPLSIILNQKSYLEFESTAGKAIVEGIAFNPILVIAFCLFAPLTILYLFSFLNQRRSSDFYHSIPQRRERVFLSYVCSILTWVVASILVCGAVSMAIYAWGSAYVSVNATSVLLYVLSIIASTVLITGATLTAMSVTGNVFSNIVTALLIIFLPRLIITAFTGAVASNTPIISAENFGFLGDYSFNILFSFVIGLITWGLGETFASVGGIIYTAVLGLIYLGGALVLFQKRKSEIAGVSAVSPGMQTVIRVLLSFAVCVVGCTAVIDAMHSGFSGGTWVSICVIYGVALIVYFAYELVSTRKLGNVVKTLPAIGILVALNVLFVGGAELIRNDALDRELAPEEISEVSINSLNYDPYNQYQTYQYYRISEIPIENAEVIRLLTEALDRDVQQIRDDDYYHTQALYKVCTFNFKLDGGRTVRRNIRLFSDEEKKLVALLAEVGDFTEAYMSLPEDPESITMDFLPRAEALALYETFREEVKTLDFAAWYKLLESQGSSAAFPYTSLYVTGYSGSDTYWNYYPVTNLTPVTAKKMMERVNETSREQVLTALSDTAMQEKDWTELEIDITAFIPETGKSYNSYSYIYHSDEADTDQSGVEVDDEMRALIKREIEGQGAVDQEAVHYMVSVFFRTYSGDWSTVVQEGGTFFFNSDSQELLELIK